MELNGKVLPLGSADIRRIANDDVIPFARKRLKEVRADRTDPVLDFKALAVDISHFKCIRRNVHRIDLGIRKRECARNCDAATARTKVKNALDPIRLHPRRELSLDQFSNRRARNQNPFIDIKLLAREWRLMGQVSQGLALTNSAIHEIKHSLTLCTCQSRLEITTWKVIRQMQGMKHQSSRLI